MSDTEAEKRAYAKGYAAGRKRTEAETAAAAAQYEESQQARRRFRQQAFLAALSGTLTSPRQWRNGEKPWVGVEDYVRGCWNFADKATAHNTEPFA